MLKRTFSGAIAGLAASLGLATAVHATTLTFNDVDFQGGDYLYSANDYIYGGLHFSDEGMVVMPGDWMGYPLNISSKFLEFGSAADVRDSMDISLEDGGAFDFLSLSLGLGDGNITDVFDNVTITGHKAANCHANCDSPMITLQVGYNFQFYSLSGFTGLSGITISQQYRPGQTPLLDTGWLAMDDVSFREIPPDNGGGAVPEPSAWALMIVGFGGVGALMRRRGRQSALPSAAA